MLDRWAQPVWKSSQGALTQLERLSVGKERLTEADLRDLLADRPSLLPVQSFDPVFASPVCLGTEFPVPGVGRVDALFLSPSGYLTLVETKLWKNPEARREVVAQVIDYARDLTRWTYSELESRFLKRGFVDRTEAESLFSYVWEGDDDESEQMAFADATGRCLRDGRFLLLIVGDGIREGVADMADFLQQSPTLQYTLGLVELACYRDPARPGDVLYVPQVVTRSQEVVRAVVQIKLRGLDDEQVAVTADVPIDTSPHPPRPDPLSEHEFYQQLTSSTSEALADQLRVFVKDLLHKCANLSGRFTSRAMRVNLLHAEDDDLIRGVLIFSTDGWLSTSKKWLDFLEANSLDLAETFADRLGAIDERLRPRREDGKFTVPKRSNAADLAAVAPNFDQVLAIISEAVERVTTSDDSVE